MGLWETSVGRATTSGRETQVSATLRVKREGVGIELRRGTFDVAVDGTGVGSLERHLTLEVPVEAGRHVLRVQAGRYSSRDRALEATDGGIVDFRCHGAMIWPRYLLSILMPATAISLRRA
jgi:hypothetical protein